MALRHRYVTKLPTTLLQFLRYSSRIAPKIKDLPRDGLRSSTAAIAFDPNDPSVTPDILAKRADPLWSPVYPSPPRRDVLDLTFENYQQCYRSKTTGEIFRALIVLNLCRSTWLVDHNLQVSPLWGRSTRGANGHRAVPYMSLLGLAGSRVHCIHPKSISSKLLTRIESPCRLL